MKVAYEKCNTLIKPGLQPRSLHPKSGIVTVRPPYLHGEGPRMVEYLRHGEKLMDLQFPKG